MISRTEAMQAGVGILTVAHGAAHGTAIADIKEALTVLRQGVLDLHIDISDVPGECDTVVRQVAQEVAEELSRRAQQMVNGCVKAFVEVATAYERDCPDADIPALLQKASLDLATEQLDDDA
ncbi:hypothetical protein ALI144C_23765 [Actinosynnema sp. ALI-1.44]|uniref:hypothetical protein n=1 Tax=Actinosynnema sp. ALI-1.44 TaxID=1933779 RepID=UPI00097BAAB4|nr:hypothetical protein [Actinosynnema sp. ALI-1.44]ONI79767.1 hypothetical protein ALI144C_23765 [Actinosynnema sp. ALI-1.44]